MRRQPFIHASTARGFLRPRTQGRLEAPASRTCPACGCPFEPVQARQVHCRPSCGTRGAHQAVDGSLFDALADRGSIDRLHGTGGR